MKWWFSDYDGTININHDENIDIKDLNFINKWIKDENEFIIASGRMFNETKKNLQRSKLSYKYIISANGASIYDSNDQLIYEKSIEMKDRQRILDVVSKYKNKFALAICVGDKRISWHNAKIPTLDAIPMFKEYIPRLNQDEIIKKLMLNEPRVNLVYLYGEEQILLNFLSEIRKLLPELTILRTHNNVVEIMHNDVSKGKAVKWFVNNYDITPDDVFVSGDGENDIEMLATFSNSFAMKVSQPGVHEAANSIINHVYEIENYLK
ncbi:Cof-type HAD-IIB family hydrolase [Spiroplasma endosymbiont of Labia minor]|uniref:Cof-type HAD-IIB family hydrolase n=1 Tax=Spiroplasma endosymbiont of Labia minor TaxID=3066305 RepID=UPI0030CDAA58